MKKNIFFLGLLVLVVLFSGCNKISLKKTENNPKNTIKQEKKANVKNITGTVKDLLGMHKDQKCEYQGPEGQTGTIYISDNKLRSDIVIAIDKNKQMISHMIQDKGYVYTWRDNDNSGMKMRVDMNLSKEIFDHDKNKNKNEEMQRTEDFNILKENFNYNCRSWTVDSSKFTLPEGVNFLDLSKMVDTLKKSIPSINSVCDSLSGEKKENCQKGMQDLNNKIGL